MPLFQETMKQDSATKISPAVSTVNTFSGNTGGLTLIGGTATTDDLTLKTTSGIGATGADMHFLVGNNGATEAMTILNAGLVGIGTASPGAKLDVSSTAGGAGSGIRLIQAAQSGSAQDSYVPIDFTVPTTGLMGQFLATAANYSSAGVNLPANSLAVVAEASAGTLWLAAAGASGNIRFNTGGYTLAKERMRIDSTGLVGIGETAMAAKLHLSNDDPAVLNAIYQFSYDGGTGPSMQFRKSRGTIAAPTVASINDSAGGLSFAILEASGNFRQTALIESYVDATPGSGDSPGRLIFSTTPDGSTTPAERMRIDSTGSVGIGTTGPGVPLEVYKSGTGTTLGQLSNNIRLNNPQLTTANAGSEISFRGGTSATDAVSVYGAISAPITDASTDGAYGYLSFSTKAARATSGLTERVRIDNNGNVGIGTTSPSYSLSVNGNIELVGANKVIYLESTNAGIIGNGANGLNFRTGGASGKMVILTDGNVGIGTASPATSAILDLTSTTGALIVPRMTTTQRDAMTAVNGMIIYNSTTNAFNFYENGAWVLK